MCLRITKIAFRQKVSSQDTVLASDAIEREREPTRWDGIVDRTFDAYRGILLDPLILQAESKKIGEPRQLAVGCPPAVRPGDADTSELDCGQFVEVCEILLFGTREE